MRIEKVVKGNVLKTAGQQLQVVAVLDSAVGLKNLRHNTVFKASQKKEDIEGSSIWTVTGSLPIEAVRLGDCTNEAWEVITNTGGVAITEKPVDRIEKLTFPTIKRKESYLKSIKIR